MKGLVLIGDIGQYSTAERSIADMMEKKMSKMHSCESEALSKLSGSAWLQMFDPTRPLRQRLGLVEGQLLPPKELKPLFARQLSLCRLVDPKLACRTVS